MAKLKQRGVSRHVINPPKTSHAPFTASHTELNAKNRGKTQTLGREKSVRKREEKSRKRSDLAPRSCLPVAPQYLMQRSPPDKTKKARTEATQKTKKKTNIYISESQRCGFRTSSSQVSQDELSGEEEEPQTPESDLPDNNKPATAVKTTPKNTK